ncbi:MAG: carbamoyl-phosphate synthase large subunit [Desulfuromonas sp.]
MPKRNDIHKILIIGSGPIIIGQACEFDYSGTQACKALRNLGYEILLVNSNPATIMTDPDMADITYIEALTPEVIGEIIKRERPDALLPNLGGQTALNLAMELERRGILDQYGVEVIGVNLRAIERGEDRDIFKTTMDGLGIEMARSAIANTMAEAKEVLKEISLPVVIRPAYTMGGTGGGFAYNLEEFENIVSRGLSLSPVSQVLIEESIMGWEELELEVVRDAKGQKITVCFIENVDAVGVHTGDSFCTAPMLTIAAEVQARLQRHAYAIVDAIGVIGGTNVQFAYHPTSGRIIVIEINPRTSRSSALASKATGFPIALISAQLAVGLTLDEIPYWRDGTLDKYTPSGDYVVVKFARWAFEKFKGVQDKLGTQMRAVGEVMSIGKNYKEAMQKAIRSLEIDRYGFGFASNFNSLSLDALMQKLAEPSSERHFLIYEALRKGADIDTLAQRTYIKPWFLQQMRELVELEEQLLKHTGRLPPDELLRQAKRDGFADKYLGQLLQLPEVQIRIRRLELDMGQAWEAVPVSGVEDAAYYYSSYNVPDTVHASTRKKIMVLGGGPNRIGQGIEFDYCCVHTAMALREAGYETIMVNCNPSTVSTDYDTSDKLYFEPLTVEDVLSIYAKEQPEGVVVQFGGQTPLNIAAELEAAGVTIIGTSPATIDQAEDRDQFNAMMEKLHIPQPESGMASTLAQALDIAARIGYPLIVRPSYVLGGRAMEIVHAEDELRTYLDKAVVVSPERPILIDRFLENAIEAEADAICDGTDAFVPAVMEHIEMAGVHSGDSACVIPPINIAARHIQTIEEYTRRIAVEMGVVGLMNIQYAIAHDKVYIIEANPRASRTVPLVSKVCNIPMPKIAVELMLGKKLADMHLKSGKISHFGVKEAVFPFNMFPEVDPVLGPEMRSTGEVLGLADSYGLAFFKAQNAAGGRLPQEGRVLITVAEEDKVGSIEVARQFLALGFTVVATAGTAAFMHEKGLKVETIFKLHEGRPNITDAVTNGEIQLVINTPAGRQGSHDDSYIRKAAIKYKVPYMTTIAAAIAAAQGIEARRKGEGEVRSLQEYHSRIL